MRARRTKATKQRAKRKTGGRVRVEDIARAVGVSGATVSRALNGTGPVADDVRSRIEAVALELGYVPNGAARALASQRTRTIGAILPTLENPNFAACAEALQRRARDAGYSFLLASSGYDRKSEFEQVGALAAHGIDGLVLVGAERDSDAARFLATKRIPYVVTWVIARDGTPSVGFDNGEAARRLVTHLMDLGHTHIGVIAGIMRDNDRAQGRVDGIRRALAERGLALPQERLIERPYRIIEGQLALRALLAAPAPPTAVICGNDQLAFGALIECNRQGVNVPRDLSIVGFDDLEFASQLVPALTTMHVPAEDIGRRAAEYLVARIAGEPASPVVEVPVTLVVRDSTAPPARTIPSPDAS